MRSYALAALMAAIVTSPAVAGLARPDACGLEAYMVHRFALIHQANPDATDLTLVTSVFRADGKTFGIPGNEAKELGMVKLANFAIYAMRDHPDAGPIGAEMSYYQSCIVAGPWVFTDAR
jgi:hypothetical protein